MFSVCFDNNYAVFKIINRSFFFPPACLVTLVEKKIRETELVWPKGHSALQVGGQSTCPM